MTEKAKPLTSIWFLSSSSSRGTFGTCREQQRRWPSPLHGGNFCDIGAETLVWFCSAVWTELPFCARRWLSPGDSRRLRFGPAWRAAGGGKDGADNEGQQSTMAKSSPPNPTPTHVASLFCPGSLICKMGRMIPPNHHIGLYENQ